MDMHMDTCMPMYANVCQYMPLDMPMDICMPMYANVCQCMPLDMPMDICMPMYANQRTSIESSAPRVIAPMGRR